ncbi:hypothetical protein ACOMCU_27545 [Lysinibacillus sp. UGB7]|uniref:hypothetical protein n=1 Tax=Lysinibacillus sp. UGB7 TaxID=3411039 RepID=UPI003B78E2EE
MSKYAGQLLLFGLDDNDPNETVYEAPKLTLLDKFNAIDISVDQRISEHEVEFCKRQEMIFYETRDMLKKYLDEMTILYDKYSEKNNDIDRAEGFLCNHEDLNKVKSRLASIYKEFVYRITNFFERRHKVSLSYTNIEEKNDENSISFSVILEEIFEQLGGLSFKDKAVEEIKAASRNIIYNKNNLQITKSKLALIDCIWWDSYCSDDRKEISYDDKRVKPLFLALSHFIYGTVEMHWSLSSIYQELRKGSKEYDIFSKYELGVNYLESIKIFKNGKIELVFSDHENAEIFKNEYLY